VLFYPSRGIEKNGMKIISLTFLSRLAGLENIFRLMIVPAEKSASFLLRED
jgi:hypothetical protein